MKHKDKKKGIKLDALGEIGNIGAGKAGVALSKILNRDVSMSTPFIDLSYKPPEDSFPEEWYSKDELVVVTLSTASDHNFDLYCLFDKKSADNLLKLMFTNFIKKESVEDYTTLERSLLKEIGSILLLQYISALNKLLKVDNVATYPHIFTGKLRDIISASKTTANVGRCQSEKDTYVVNLNVFTIEEEVSATITIVPCEDTIPRFLQSLGIENKE